MVDMYSHKVAIVDLKKPGPLNKVVQCYVRRDRELSTFILWEKPPAVGWTPFCRICLKEDGLTKLLAPCSCSGTMKHVHQKCLKRWCTGKRDAICRINCLIVKPENRTTCDICHQPYKMQAAATDGAKFLLTSREVRHGKIIISSDPNPYKESDSFTVGKLKSDSQLAYTGSHTSCKIVSIEREAADVKFRYSFRLPKSIGFSQDIKGAAVIDLKKSAQWLTDISTTSWNEDDSVLLGEEVRELKSAIQNYNSGHFESTSCTEKPSVLKSQGPAWREKCTGWRSYFRCDWDLVLLRHNGNLFATWVRPKERFSTELLRLGKVEKDLFIMDYSYPLSAFQAFAIFLGLDLWHDTFPIAQEIPRSQQHQQ